MQDTKFIKVPHQGSQGTTYPSWRRDTWSIIEVKIGHWSLSPYEGHVPVCLAICYPGLLQPSLPRISIWNHLNINTSVGAGTRLLQLVFGRVYLYFYVHGDETIMIIIYIYHYHDDQISLHPQIFNSPNSSPIQNIQGIGARYRSAVSETESAPWAEPKQQRPLPPKKQKSPRRPRSSCTPCPGVFGVIDHQNTNVRLAQESVVWISCVDPRLTLRLHAKIKHISTCNARMAMSNRKPILQTQSVWF